MAGCAGEQQFGEGSSGAARAAVPGRMPSPRPWALPVFALPVSVPGATGRPNTGRPSAAPVSLAREPAGTVLRPRRSPASSGARPKTTSRAPALITLWQQVVLALLHDQSVSRLILLNIHQNSPGFWGEFCRRLNATRPRRMDRNLRLRAPDRRAPRPPDPPRQYPRDEWRKLSPQPEQGPQRQGAILNQHRQSLALTGQSIRATASSVKSAAARMLAHIHATIAAPPKWQHFALPFGPLLLCR